MIKNYIIKAKEQYQCYQNKTKGKGQTMSLDTGHIERKIKDGHSLARLGLSGADLRGINFIRDNAKSTNLRCVDFSDTNLKGVNLCKAVFNEANLRCSNLSRADLSLTSMRCTNLSGANLVGADLVGADLTWANLSNANLIDADLSGADLSHTKGIFYFELSRDRCIIHKSSLYDWHSGIYIFIGYIGHSLEYWEENYMELVKIRGYSNGDVLLYDRTIKAITNEMQAQQKV